MHVTETRDATIVHPAIAVIGRAMFALIFSNTQPGMHRS